MKKKITIKRSKILPRGIANKKSENNFEKKLDTKNEPSIDNPHLDSDEIVAQVEEKEIPAKPSPIKKKDEEPEYTVSPDGKYKFLKPKAETHSDYLEETNTNIPYFTVPGYVIVWPHDAKSSDIPDYVRKGYEFANPDLPGWENARERPLARMMKDDGTPSRHYCMFMSEEKFKEMKKREQDRIDQEEQQMKLKPSTEAGIYATDQMSMAQAYKRRGGQ